MGTVVTNLYSRSFSQKGHKISFPLLFYTLNSFVKGDHKFHNTCVYRVLFAVFYHSFFSSNTPHSSGEAAEKNEAIQREDWDHWEEATPFTDMQPFLPHDNWVKDWGNASIIRVCFHTGTSLGPIFPTSSLGRKYKANFLYSKGLSPLWWLWSYATHSSSFSVL